MDEELADRRQRLAKEGQCLHGLAPKVIKAAPGALEEGDDPPAGLWWKLAWERGGPRNVQEPFGCIVAAAQFERRVEICARRTAAHRTIDEIGACDIDPAEFPHIDGGARPDAFTQGAQVRIQSGRGLHRPIALERQDAVAAVLDQIESRRPSGHVVSRMVFPPSPNSKGSANKQFAAPRSVPARSFVNRAI